MKEYIFVNQEKVIIVSSNNSIEAIKFLKSLGIVATYKGVKDIKNDSLIPMIVFNK